MLIKNFSDFFFRHEVPVSSEEIKIVHIDDDLVVVNKPASIPVSFFFFFGKNVMTCTSVFRERTQKKSFFPFSTKR